MATPSKEVTTTLSFPLTSRHFSPTTSRVTVQHVPKKGLAGNRAADGSALNTGLSVWFGAENMIETLAPVLDERFEESDGAKVLELGAGTGVTSLFVMDYFVARRVSVKIDLTDGIDEALTLLGANVRFWTENGSDDRGIVNATVSKNFWGNTKEEGGFVSVDGGYDMLYGSDLIYERCEDDKVQALASTVYWMLSGTEKSVDYDSDGDVLFEPPDDGYLNDLTYVPQKGSKLFALSFTRRSYPLVQLIGTFEQAGLRYDGTLENSCWDLFGNNTDGLTEMWRDCVLVFSLITPL